MVLVKNRRDPFIDFFDRVIDNAVSSAEAGFTGLGTVKTSEVKGHRVIKVALPGVSKDQVKVSLEDGHVIWEVEDSRSGQNSTFAVRSSGSYYLSGNLDSEGIRADVTDGILTIAVPYKSKPEPQGIELTTGADLALEDSGAEESESGTMPMTETRSSTSSRSENISEDKHSSGGEPDKS